MKVFRPSEIILDETAIEDYKEKLKELEEAVKIKTAEGNLEEAKKLDVERDFILGELKKSKYKKNFAPETDKERIRIRKLIVSAIKKLEAHFPALAEHLHKHLTTGHKFIYDPPDPAPHWIVR